MFGALINLSGRRRFTSQRVILYAVLASLGHDAALEMSRDALKLFKDAHTVLVQGNSELPGVFSEALRLAYFGPLQGDKNISDFIASAERALNAIRSNAHNAPTALDELVCAATPLLEILNRLTQVYEEESKKHAIKMKKELHGLMTNIESIAKTARMVSFNAQIIAARAGTVGREFSVVANELTNITGEIDDLVHTALKNSVCGAPN